MKGISLPKFMFSCIIFISLILITACIDPVTIDDIKQKQGTIKFDEIKFELGHESLNLTIDGEPLLQGDDCSLVLGTSAVITVSNEGFTDINWYWSNNLLKNTKSYTLNTNTDPYINKKGAYIITVDAKKNNAPHSSYFILEVE